MSTLKQRADEIRAKLAEDEREDVDGIAMLILDRIEAAGRRFCEGPDHLSQAVIDKLASVGVGVTNYTNDTHCRCGDRDSDYMCAPCRKPRYHVVEMRDAPH